MNKTITVNESFRKDSRKRGSRKQRISLANNSILANSEIMPATQQRFMDVLSTKVMNDKIS